MSLVAQRGYNAKAAYKEEVTEGTAPNASTDTYTAFYATVEPRINRNPLPLEDAIGSRDLLALTGGIKEFDVVLTHYPSDINLIKYAITDVNKSLALWVKYEDLAYQHVYTGCKANDLTLDGTVGAYLEASMTLWAIDLSTAAPGSAVFGTLPTSVPFHWKDQAVKIDGSVVPEVRAFRVSVENNLERIPRLGSEVIRASRERNRAITGELTMTFESTAHIQKVLDYTSFTLDIDLGKEGATTHTISLTGCRFGEVSIPLSRTDLVALRLPFIATGISLT